jgi:thioesterase domain-containing protein
VSKLAGRIAVQGLRDPVYFEQAPEQRDVTDLAKRYLDNLNGQVPRVLVGWSFGAMVAWQMAHHLQSKGVEPPRLVLIDPPAIGFHAASGLGADAVLARELRGVPAANGQDQAFTTAMRTACTLNATAMQSFNPEGQNIAAGATLLVAQDGEAPPTGFASRADWLVASWQPLMQRKLAVQTFDADHYAIMNGAAADRITQIIVDDMRAAEPEDALR